MRSLLVIILSLMLSSIYAQPSISSFTPVSANAGTSLTINGSGFDATTTNNVVYVGNALAAVTSASTTQLTVTVPYGALYEKIVVLNETSGLLTQSSGYFLPQSSDNVVPINRTAYSAWQNEVSGASSSSGGELICGDYDMDGDADFLSSPNNTSGIIHWENNTSSNSVSFSKLTTIIPTNSAHNVVEIISGDLDMDGDLDLVALHSETSGSYFDFVSYWLNDGTGSFGTETEIAITYNTYADEIELADVDSDGDLDILIGATFRLIILKNTSLVFTETTFAASSRMRDIRIADLDNDGKIDIASFGQAGTTNAVEVFHNACSGATLDFDTRVLLNSAASNSSGALIDVNQDGLLDLASHQLSSPYAVEIFENTNTVSGTLSFNSTPVSFARLAEGSGYDLCSGDLNGDAYPDLLATTYTNNTHYFSVLENTSQANITTASFNTYFSITHSDGVTSLRNTAGIIADINNDGNNDLLGITTLSNSFVIFESELDLLPVELTKLSAVAVKDEILVEWATSFEENSDYFEVEYSLDGLDWNHAGIIQAQGHSMNEIFYSLKFDNQDFENCIVQLKQFDYNGEFSTYGPVEVIGLGNGYNSVDAYISDKQLVINSDQHLSACIYSADGSLIKQFVIQRGKEYISMDNFKPGIYFLKTEAGYSKKLLLK